MTYSIGIDLGGTNIVAGLVEETYHILLKKSCPTLAPRPAEDICRDIAVLCQDLLRDCRMTWADISYVGVGAPGILNSTDGVIEYASNLQFHRVPFAAILGELLDKQVLIENDANAAAYGEFLAGAGRGTHSLVAITLGTGIGGGIIIHDQVYSGHNHAGAEIGHIVIEAKGKPCSCGKLGCFEAYASATALIQQTKESMLQHQDSIMWELCGGDIRQVSGKTAFDGMRRQDGAAKQVVNNFLYYLSVGVANVITILQPEVLCIGGGLSKEGDYILIPLRKLVAQQTIDKEEQKRTKIVAANLGNDAGVIGAAMLYREKMR